MSEADARSRSATGLVVAPTPHYCRPPMVERWITPPKFEASEPDPEPCQIEEVPPVGSVWRCECGRCFEACERRHTPGFVVFGNEWLRISQRRYRRQVRRLTATHSNPSEAGSS